MITSLSDTLHQRVVGVSARQLGPDKHHRRARCSAQQNEPGDILVRLIRINQICKQSVKKQYTKCCHREGFDQPVHDNGDDESFWFITHVAQTAEVHRHHHRIDHRPDENGDDQID